MVPGLSITLDKTKIVKIWACRAKRLTKGGLEWTSEFEAFGIAFDVNDWSNITEPNIKRKLQSMITLLRLGDM